MELELGENELDVGADEGAVACGRESMGSKKAGREEEKERTSRNVSSDSPRASLQPPRLILRLLESLWVEKKEVK